MSALLEARGVSCGYGRLKVLHDVDLHVGRGELVVLLGANGAGKSTLVAALVGWLKPTSGSIAFKGRDVTALAPWSRSRAGLGVVPERGRVFGDLTVAENLEVARPTAEGLRRVHEVFPILAERRHQLARTLSGGQRQMLALARALAKEPELLLVDEMSTGLMPMLVAKLFAVLRRLADAGLPILLVEQNTKVLDIADRAYVMQTGSIILEGDAESLKRDEGVRKAYLGA
ncbi:MAG TPA: ABC transporter ATP-binding protein [Trueperaceae bacterium]|nr:ABC transporter ATP-binding protein [Trueperaceae bacterium]